MSLNAKDCAAAVHKIAADIAAGMATYQRTPKGGIVRSALMGTLTSRMRLLELAVANLDRRHCQEVAEDCRQAPQTQWEAEREWIADHNLGEKS